MSLEYDPAELVNTWPLVRGLSQKERDKITAQLLKASTVYKRGNPSEMRRFIAPINQAYDGIARVLFDTRILTPEILRNDLPLFLLEAAIAARWLHFPQPLSEAWAEFTEAYPDVFSAERDTWRAHLLEDERDSQERHRVTRFKILSDEYLTIEFNGRRYALTKNQAVIVRTLHAAYLAKQDDVAITDIFKALHINSGKMSQWFRGKNRPLFKKLVVQSGSRNHYRLDI
jgi:hypothetical protein